MNVNAVNERARLAVLRQLNLLDTPPSESFDRITRMASLIFNLPVAAISLTDQDRQWFKSRVGVDHWEIPRFRACCGEVTDTNAVLVVNDLLASDYYRESYLAESGIRFYAGAPLMTREGFVLGAMCVLGTEPRQVTDKELRALKDLAAMVMAQIDLQHAVGRIDPTTGLCNYLSFVEDLDDLERDFPGEQRFLLSIELIDLEQVNTVQRVMGSAYLDSLSKNAARAIIEKLTVRTRVYHVGPCQFAYLVAGRKSDALELATQLRLAILAIKINGIAPFMLRPVVGVAPVQLGQVQADDVLRLAHATCRDVRDQQIETGFYSKASDQRYQRQFRLMGDFIEALESGTQLHLAYQPRIEVSSGRTTGAEALIRWQHPEFGNISPAEFIPLVENSSMAKALTDWVMCHSIRQAAVWYRQGRHLRVSINVAAANLEESDFIARLCGYLDKEHLPLAAIELELTESGLVSNGRVARQHLEDLVALGVRVAIDDFGTGYSSLAYLQDIPAQVVKIDRSFITHLGRKERSHILVNSMITMAHDLGYRVVGEGVETEEAREVLASLGCDEIQGYLIAKPLPASDFEHWFQDAVHPVLFP